MKGHFRGQSLQQRCPWRMTRDRYIWFCYALEIPRYHFPLLIHIRMRINFIIISASHTVLMEISHGTGCLDSAGRSCNCTYMRNVMFLPEVKMKIVEDRWVDPQVLSNAFSSTIQPESKIDLIHHSWPHALWLLVFIIFSVDHSSLPFLKPEDLLLSHTIFFPPLDQKETTARTIDEIYSCL